MLQIPKAEVRARWIEALAQCNQCQSLFTLRVKVVGKQIIGYDTDPKFVILHRQPCHRCNNNGKRGRVFFFSL